MTNYNIEIREFNGIDYDIFYPITKVENIQGLQEELNKKTSLEVYSKILYRNSWIKDTVTGDYIQNIQANGVLPTDNIIMRIGHFEETETPNEIRNKIIDYNKLKSAYVSVQNSICVSSTNALIDIDLPVIFFVLRGG